MSGPEIALRATQGGLGAPMGVDVGPGATAFEIGPQIEFSTRETEK